jgi:hypothetical protein
MRNQWGTNQTPEQAKKSRSTAMVVLGLLMFVWLGLLQTASGGAPLVAVVVLGVLGAGLIVGGLVIRP